jgi:O-antigen ligase
LEGVKRIYSAYKHPSAVREQRGHLHNNPMQVAVERGIIGLLCWLWIWFAFYRDQWRMFRRQRAPSQRATALVIGSLASVTAFHVAGLFEYSFGDSEVMMLVYYLMALPYVVRGLQGEAGAHASQV